MTPRWIHASFCGIWLITAGVFFVLGADAQDSENTTLERFQPLRQRLGGIEMNGIDPIKELNNMGELTNSNIGKLETSIRHTARFQFWLNIISFFAALLGFGTQASAYVYETRAGDKPKARRAHRVIPPAPLDEASAVEGKIQHADTHAPKRVRRPRKHPITPAGASET
jgi:hypothetical protein